MHNGKTVRGWQTQHPRKDGQQILVTSSYAPTRHARGEVKAVVSVRRDVSDLKHMLAQIESDKDLFCVAHYGIPTSP